MRRPEYAENHASPDRWAPRAESNARDLCVDAAAARVHEHLPRASKESLRRQRLEGIETLTPIDVPQAGRLRESQRKTRHFAILRPDEGYQIVRMRRCAGEAEQGSSIHGREVSNSRTSRGSWESLKENGPFLLSIFRHALVGREQFREPAKNSPLGQTPPFGTPLFSCDRNSFHGSGHRAHRLLCLR